MLAVLAMALLASGLLIARGWSQPLGPTLAVSQRGTTITVTPLPLGGSTLAPTPVPVCDGPPIMYILAIGVDLDEATVSDTGTPQPGGDSGFADAIRLVRVNFVQPSVTILSIPRDLSVHIPNLLAYEIVQDRLRMAYAYGNAYQLPGGGPGLLAETLATNFDAQIDHYVVIDFSAFVAGINAVGGVDIYVPAPVGDFTAGKHHMDGATALMYARMREDVGESSDRPRVSRQTQLIRALEQKVLSPSILPNLPRLAASFQDSVITDLSPQQISTLTCLAGKLESGDVYTLSLPTSTYTSQMDVLNHEVLAPDYDAITTYIRDFNAGMSH